MLKRVLTAAVAAIGVIIATDVGFGVPSGAALATPMAEADGISISAKSAILIDAMSGMVIFEKNAQKPMQIASTTKILTALVVLEQCNIDETIEIRREWTGIEGSSMYLRAGEKLTVRDLLYGLLLHSGNDAAVALACHSAGSIAEFAELMNARAAELGCTDSLFVNPHGLDATGHLASAADLAKITAAAMENEDFVAIVSTKYASIAGRSLKNHNKLLWNYEGTLGVKTGYTKSAGRSLVSCAERDGVRLICITLSDPNDWADHAALFDLGFSTVERRTLEKGTQLTATVPVLSGVKENVALKTGAALSLTVRRGAEVELVAEVPQFIYAVVVRGGYAGTARVEADGEVVARVPIFYTETVRRDETEPLTKWELFRRAWYRANEYGGYYRMGFYY